MDSNGKKIVETSILLIDPGHRETEVTIGIGFPSGNRCCVYFDGFEKPHCRSGVDDWQAFFIALKWLAFMLENLEDRGYTFALNECEPPLPCTALELIHGMTFTRTTDSKNSSLSDKA